MKNLNSHNKSNIVFRAVSTSKFLLFIFLCCCFQQVQAQEQQPKSATPLTTAQLQKIAFRNTIYKKVRVLKANYQKQIDSVMKSDLDGKQKWEQLNAISKARNQRMQQINEQMKQFSVGSIKQQER